MTAAEKALREAIPIPVDPIERQAHELMRAEIGLIAADAEDCWRAAVRVIAKLLRAVELEREACAAIVDRHAALWSDDDVLTDFRRVAAAIRARGDAGGEG